jgi:hypothetical protein
MDQPPLHRRDFHRLTMAAFGGALAGTLAGCSDDKPPAPVNPAPRAGAEVPTKPEGGAEVADNKGDPHACSGLNSCKGQGASGTNDCAGQGDCATKSWHHGCSGENACKGQGGCGETATINDCKGKGGCHVPLMAGIWETARKHFEEKMKDAGKEIGPGSPPKKK